jgi:ABC-type transport system involved in multi-copper enzyme maturation permease subunit
MSFLLNQTSAFVTRSVRQESRLLSHHLIRAAMVGMMLYLLLLQLAGFNRMNAAGLTLIQNVMSCCYWCLTMLGIMYFSVAITEEKEEETLPLLRMTGVRNVTLLLGKSLPRLAVVLLLIMVSAPFLMLSVTLGGVLREQIIGSLLGLMCYAFCLSQAGLLCSTVCRNSSRAISATTLIWVLLEFGSWMIWLLAISGNRGVLLGRSFSNGPPGPITSFLLWTQAKLWSYTMWQASKSYLSIEQGDSIVHPQMLFHLTIGAAMFGLSWLLFERFNQHAIANGAVAAIGPRAGGQRKNANKAVRPWEKALTWKSWQLIGGGIRRFWLGIVALPALCISIVFCIGLAVGEMAPGFVYGIVLMAGGVGALAVMLARLFGTVLSSEVKDQTLVSLFLLPQSTRSIVMQSMRGLLPFLISPVLCFLLGYFWTALSDIGRGGRETFVTESVKVMFQPWTWAMIGWAVTTVHLGTLLSVCFRHGGMMIAFVMCWIIAPFLSGILMSMVAYGIRPGPSIEDFVQYFLPMFLLGVEALACWKLQKMTLDRLELLAAK